APSSARPGASTNRACCSRSIKKWTAATLRREKPIVEDVHESPGTAPRLVSNCLLLIRRDSRVFPERGGQNGRPERRGNNRKVRAPRHWIRNRRSGWLQASTRTLVSRE